MRVRITTPLHASEDPAKVQKAIRHIFPDATLETMAHEVIAHTASMEELGRLIRRQKILDAARKSFLRGLEPGGRRGRFTLSKQAAYQGRASFAGDVRGPLGDLVVEAEDPHLEAILKSMAPMTLRGIPVSEERAEEELRKRRMGKTTPTSEEDYDEDLDEDEEDALNQDEEDGHGDDED